MDRDEDEDDVICDPDGNPLDRLIKGAVDPVNAAFDMEKLIELLKAGFPDSKTAAKKDLEAVAEEIARMFDAISWIDDTFAGDWSYFKGDDRVWIRIGICTPEFADRIKIKERFPQSTEFFTAVNKVEPSLLIGIAGWPNKHNDMVMGEFWKCCEKIKRGGDGTQWEWVQWLMTK